MRLYSGDYTTNHNENEEENERRSHRYYINRPIGLDMDTNIINIRSVSVWWCLYVLSNT